MDDATTINVSADGDGTPYSVSGTIDAKDAQRLMLTALGNDPSSKGLRVPKGRYSFRLTMTKASDD